jgi:pimeloyl-ACP methyl ester carboxylesterase
MTATRIRSSDAEIVYWQLGSGPDVVLLHPFPANHEVWMPVAETLAPRYRLLLPDLRGHGESQPGEGPATMEKHAADLLCLCQDAEVRRAVFAGVSIGGYILFEFWRRYRDRVSAFVFCDTRAQADTAEGRTARLAAADDVCRRGVDPFLDSMIPRLLGKSTQRNRPDVVAAARRMMGNSTPAGISAAQRGMAERPDSGPTLETINIPTLILAGEEDTLTPVADAKFLHSRIRGSRLQVIPRAGHYAPLENSPACASILREFLQGLPEIHY